MNFGSGDSSVVMDTTMTETFAATMKKSKSKGLTSVRNKPVSSALNVRTKSNLVASTAPDLKAAPYAQFLPLNFMHKYITNNNKPACELCHFEFKKVSLDKDQRRTHCRRCGKSICSWCASNML